MSATTNDGAFHEGQVAAEEGRKLSRNPYVRAMQPMLWGSWRNGWAFYHDERQKKLDAARKLLASNPVRKRSRSK